MKNQLIMISLSIYLFSGCATDNAMISVDNSEIAAQTTYEDSKFLLNNTYQKTAKGIDSATDSIYENSFMQLFISDKSIIENRKRFIKWDSASYEDIDFILFKYFYKKKKKIDIKGIDLSQKIMILNEHFYNQEQEIYSAKFLKRNPKPKFDKFKSDRENIQMVNNYKFQLNLSKNNWLLKLDDIKKRVAQKTITTLYGTPSLNMINYDPNDNILFAQIVSKRNGFKQKISFEVGAKTAKYIKNNKNTVLPKVYFKLVDDNIELVGASIKFNSKEYLVKLTDKTYKRTNNIKIVSQDLELEKLNVDYKVASQDINPPVWFYKLNTGGKTIGYGMGDTQQEAKNTALKEIAQTLGVKVDSSTSTQKKSDGNNFSKRTQQNVNISSKKIDLKGAKTIKSVKKDGTWFLAVSY